MNSPLEDITPLLSNFRQGLENHLFRQSFPHVISGHIYHFSYNFRLISKMFNATDCTEYEFKFPKLVKLQDFPELRQATSDLWSISALSLPRRRSRHPLRRLPPLPPSTMLQQIILMSSLHWWTSTPSRRHRNSSSSSRLHHSVLIAYSRNSHRRICQRQRQHWVQTVSWVSSVEFVELLLFYWR